MIKDNESGRYKKAMADLKNVIPYKNDITVKQDFTHEKKLAGYPVTYKQYD